MVCKVDEQKERERNINQWLNLKPFSKYDQSPCLSDEGVDRLSNTSLSLFRKVEGGRENHQERGGTSDTHTWPYPGSQSIVYSSGSRRSKVLNIQWLVCIQTLSTGFISRRIFFCRFMSVYLSFAQSGLFIDLNWEGETGSFGWNLLPERLRKRERGRGSIDRNDDEDDDYGVLKVRHETRKRFVE